MPSLSLSSGVSKARDTKRTQLIVDDPITPYTEAVWDDVYERANITYLSSGTTYLSVQATSANGFCAMEFTVIPYSKYTITAVLTSVFGSTAGADVLVGTGTEDETFVDGTDGHLSSSGGTVTETFNVLNNTSVWVTLNTVAVSVAYWDSIKIQEAG
mgnify:CR=1 FL=1